MNPIKTKSTNRVLGAPKNWDAAKNGECVGLPVLRVDQAYYSFWKPSLAERIAMLFGRPVMLGIFSGGHPPVSVNVAAERNP